MKYIVSDAYGKILGEGAGDEEEVFQILWKSKATPAAQICAWRLVLNRLSAKDKLLRVRVSIGITLCVLCNLGEENSSHLFFTYEVSRSLWNRYEGWLGV